MARCVYPDRHEWRLIKEFDIDNAVGIIIGKCRRYYCIHCRTIVEDNEK